MKSQADQKNMQSPQPPGRKEEPQPDRGQGGGQPKPGNDQDYETPDIPEELPKREIDRKPSDPQSEPDAEPKPEMPDKGPDKSPKQDIPENEENNDVEEQSPDIVGEKKNEDDSLVDSRDRFPFPNK